MILFLTNREDITTDIIINRLNSMKVPYYRLNTELLVDSVGFNFDICSNSYFLLDYSKNLKIDLNKIKSVYYRRPKIPEFNNGSLSENEKIFIKNETAYMIEGLYKILSNKFWLSPVFSIREAENKIYQLILAKKLGFEIPFSLITSIDKYARKFVEENKYDCIIKPIKSGLIGSVDNAKVVFTSAIKDEQIDSLYRVNKYPTFFQNRIHKQADVRVTIVGTKIFAAKIYSQEYEETKVDWRRGNNTKLKYEVYNLNNELTEKCLSLTRYLNLNYGAIDFVENEDGELIFLEINPNGQWGWIEKRLNYDISGEIIKLLIEGKIT